MAGMPQEAESWVTIERSDKGEWARVVMTRDPVNSMNYAFWKRMTDVLHACEQAADIRGVIFCSGLKRPIFTAGNDLGELYAPATSRDRYKRFWCLSNEFLCALYLSPLLTVSAIKGACPAGGCAISLCCDYRVMTDSGRIGLNEVELGIPVPKFWALLMGRATGTGVADKLCGFAQMCTPQRALELGLIDEVATGAQLMQASETAVALMLKLPDVGRMATKQQSRGDFVDAWRKYYTVEAEIGFTQLQQPATVEALRAVRDRLSGGGGARSRL